MDTGTRLATARRAANVSQEELAKVMGKTAKTIQNWEAGKGEPRVSQAHTIAAALQANPEYLLGLTDRLCLGE